jgi:hypothetical protein
LIWIPSDQKAPDHGTIQKGNLTSRAHPAKLATSKNLQQRGFQSGMQSLKEMVAATSSHRCQRTLLSLARLPGVNRQGGLPKVDWYIVTHSDDDKIRNSLAGSTVLVFEFRSAACFVFQVSQC